MFGLGVQELVIILLGLCLLFGARRIPELARGIGQSMSEFRRGLKEPIDEKKPMGSGQESTSA
jgi:sec-independent protein translocase protein TatA